MNDNGILDRLQAGMMIPYGGNRYTRVPAELAQAFQPGDRLLVVQETGALLHIPAATSRTVQGYVDQARAAFEGLAGAAPGAVDRFYQAFADALADDAIWRQVAQANDEDMRRALARGRSTTRLGVSDRMRADMIAGLRAWPALGAEEQRLVDRVDHGDWQVDVVRVPLGVVGFVFEGRPNVLVDACGVLSTGNTAVLRIGSDALGTAMAVRRLALQPALEAAGLPPGCVSLIDMEDRAAGWALFSDARLALAVARGSGHAVTQLGGVARQAGVPVSAHGTGGAWLVADPSADADRFEQAVFRSLDRKVCNTLNVCCIVRDRVADLMPRFLAAIARAGEVRGGTPRLHVAPGARPHVPDALFERQTAVRRAGGVVSEPYASLLPLERLGDEWEWEETPELTVAVVDDVDQAIAWFNRYSPRFVASLIAADDRAHQHFRARIDAPFVGNGFTRWVDGQYALGKPELGLSNWQYGRLLGRGGVLTGADLAAVRLVATTGAVDPAR